MIKAWGFFVVFINKITKIGEIKSIIRCNEKGEFMRRLDRAVIDRNEMLKVMDECICARVGFYDDGEVYIVPLNFGYVATEETVTLYFHSAKRGRKIALIKKCDTVGFEMDTGYSLAQNDIACKFSNTFKSIIGTGVISFVTDADEKRFALRRIMKHVTNKDEWQFNDKAVELVRVFKIEVTKMTCKAKQN